MKGRSWRCWRRSWWCSLDGAAKGNMSHLLLVFEGNQGCCCCLCDLRDGRWSWMTVKMERVFSVGTIERVDDGWSWQQEKEKTWWFLKFSLHCDIVFPTIFHCVFFFVSVFYIISFFLPVFRVLFHAPPLLFFANSPRASVFSSLFSIPSFFNIFHAPHLTFLPLSSLCFLLLFIGKGGNVQWWVACSTWSWCSGMLCCVLRELE